MMLMGGPVICGRVSWSTDFVATTYPLKCCSAPKISRRADTRIDECVNTQKSLVQDTYWQTRNVGWIS